MQLNQAKIITVKCLSRMHYNVSIARFEHMIIAIVHGAPAHFSTFLTSLVRLRHNAILILLQTYRLMSLGPAEIH